MARLPLGVGVEHVGDARPAEGAGPDAGVDGAKEGVEGGLLGSRYASRETTEKISEGELEDCGGVIAA